MAKLDLIIDSQANRLTAPVGAYDRDSDLKVSTYGVTGSLTAGFATGPFHHVVTIGGEAYFTRTSQYAGGKDNCTPGNPTCMFLHIDQSDMPDVHGTDLGFVAQDRIGFGAGDWLHVTPGVRVDWYRRSPQPTPTYQQNAAFEALPPRSSDSHVSPKVLAEAEVLPRLTLYGQQTGTMAASRREHRGGRSGKWSDGRRSPLRVNAASGLVRPITAPPTSGRRVRTFRETLKGRPPGYCKLSIPTVAFQPVSLVVPTLRRLPFHKLTDA